MVADCRVQSVGSSFANLETKIHEVGRTAVRIGEQLESLHQTRSNAQSTSLILSYYLSLVHQTASTTEAGKDQASNPHETLFATRTSREGRSRLSIILRRLMAVAKDMADNAASALTDAEGEAAATGDADKSGAKLVLKRRSEKERAERVRDEVERYCERFEKEVLRLFDRSYRKGDPRMMAVRDSCGPRGNAKTDSVFVALREDVAGLQRWSVMRADIRQSARLLHL